MNIIKSIMAVLMLCVMLFPILSYAQQPKLQSPEYINRLCEQGYNSKRKNKDCACFVDKYKSKEMEIFKQRSNGTVPPYDSVFRLIDHECNVLTPEAKSALDVCLKKPPISGLTTDQVDIFCKCQSTSLARMGAMFEQMPNATHDTKKQMRYQVLLSSKLACKDQATRKYH